jgi:hypothetical protein
MVSRSPWDYIFHATLIGGIYFRDRLSILIGAAGLMAEYAQGKFESQADEEVPQP